MSEYTKALTELVALPGQLDRQLSRAEQEVAAERRAREQEIEEYVAEHEAVLARLEATLQRARSEGVDLGLDGRDGEDDPVTLSADPVEHAGQLVTRLEEALTHLLYTRRALAAEEDSLSEEEKRRAAEQRRKREREELQRAEQWERARQGTVGLAIALVLATVAGMVAGAVGSPAAILGVAAAATLACLVLAQASTSTLPALAARRATGSLPPTPAAPARESRLGSVGHAAAGLCLTGLGATAIGLVSGAPSGAVAVAGALTTVGAMVMVAVWLLLPRAK
jgi:hypothetical protein